MTLTAWNTCTLTPLTTTARVTVTARPCLTLTGLSLAYTPTQVYTYTPVFFRAEVLTGSLPLTYTWAFGDATPPLSGTMAGPILTTTHTFSLPGAYTTTLAAWNTCTLTPTRRAVTLTVAPCEVISGVAVAWQPPAPRAGEVITFSAQVTGGSPPRHLAWSFGDGARASGAVVTHAYTAPVAYTLALTAANGCSRQVVTAALHIRPPTDLDISAGCLSGARSRCPPGLWRQHRLGRPRHQPDGDGL